MNAPPPSPEPIAVLDPACIQTLREPSLTLTEAKSDVIVLNPNQVFVDCVEVDGCVIVNGGKKCDWLVNVPAVGSSYLVELKGSDVDAAILQLETTHVRLASHLLKYKYWIISHTPEPRSTTEVADLKRELRKRKIRLLTSDSPFILTI